MPKKEALGLLTDFKNKLLPKPHFFVIGAGRGGTSLLAAMLDCHSKLEVGFERFAFDYLLGEKLSGRNSSDLNSRLQYFKTSCQTEANSSSHYWGNKITTEQIAALGECEGAEWPVYAESFRVKVIGEKKIIFIVRDGRACIQSKMKRTGQNYTTALHRWKTSIEILDYFSASNINLHLCRYEDLLARPVEELRKAADFLNVEFEEGMLEGPSNPMMPDMYRGSTIRQQATRQSTWPSHWNNDMYEELQKLGYLNGD